MLFVPWKLCLEKACNQAWWRKKRPSRFSQTRTPSTTRSSSRVCSPKIPKRWFLNLLEFYLKVYNWKWLRSRNSSWLWTRQGHESPKSLGGGVGGGVDDDTSLKISPFTSGEERKMLLKKIRWQNLNPKNWWTSSNRKTQDSKSFQKSIKFADWMGMGK